MMIYSFPINAQDEKDRESTPEDYIFTNPTVMPRFKSKKCEPYKSAEDKSEYNKCSQEAMLAFIYGNLKWPEKAKGSCITGTVVIGFVVQKDGSVEDAKIMRDIGDNNGFGEEALRVVKMMDKWEPGLYQGKPEAIRFNLPVKFGLRE